MAITETSHTPSHTPGHMPGHTPPMPPASPPLSALPRAGSRDGVAPLRGDNAQLVHLVLFVAGAVLLPTGLVVIGLGWYGVAHTPYEYDQLSYLVSGGILGLGITFCGGFLYFGAWLARVAADQKASDKRLADTLLVLADAVSHSTSQAAQAAAVPAAARPGPPPPPRVPAAQRDPASILVVVGTSSTVHRADCELIEGREDVRPAGPDGPGLVACRLCRPGRPGR
jgi:hypothetical protein